MRKSSLYSLVFFLSATLPAWSQVTPSVRPSDTADTISSRRPLLDVLIDLNRSKGVYFLFSQQSLGKVLVHDPVLSPNMTVERILNQVLKNIGLYFKKVDDRTFVILRKKTYSTNSGYDPSAGVTGPGTVESLPEADSVIFSTNNITGRIISADGKTLPGVSVTVKHSRKGTVTDLDGQFNSHAGRGDTLLFSFVGYKQRQLPAQEAGKGWIILTPSDQPMTEVLVTVLGIRKQERSLGFSATEVDGSPAGQS